MYLTIGEAANLFGVCIQTLRRWELNGRLLPDIRTAGGHRRYNFDKLTAFINNVPYKEEEKITVCYARVSTNEQKHDLERQKERLVEFAKCNSHKEIRAITDIGSGLNYKKKVC